jgi:hypothetical protein
MLFEREVFPMSTPQVVGVIVGACILPCSLTLANTKTRVMRARIALKQHYQEAGG